MTRPSLWERLRDSLGTGSPRDGHCFWSVDVHSHLLPGIDDGARDPEQTLECLTQLAEWGIKKVITTPHVNQDWYPNATDAIRELHEAVVELVREYDLPLTVEVAAEYMLDDNFLDLLQRDDLLSFGEKRYLLVETGWAGVPANLDEMLFRLRTRGYTPVLAHPERYKYFHHNKADLLRLREADCLFQLNWMSLVGRYGPDVQKQAKFLVREGMLDFIGSDLHHPHDLDMMAKLFRSEDWPLLQKIPLLNDTLR